MEQQSQQSSRSSHLETSRQPLSPSLQPSLPLMKPQVLKSSIPSNTSKRSGAKRSSLTYRRGHSEMSMVSAVRSNDPSHSMGSGSSISRTRKKLRRSISWDMRPPKVHDMNRITKPATEREGADEVGRNESWYSKEEYCDIMSEQVSCIMIMRYHRANGTNISQIDPELFCERGLESYQSSERKNETYNKRKLHQLLVIQEQTRQSMLGTKDPERLRLMAETQSEGSLLKAQLRAALDHHEVTKLSPQPLSEPEKFQVALEQNKWMTTEKQTQHLSEDDSVLVAREMRESLNVEEDATSGIIPLASLWAQEEQCSSPTTHARQGDARTKKTSPPGLSLASARLKYQMDCNMLRLFHSGSHSPQQIPLIYFSSSHQTKSPTKYPVHAGVSSQAFQNAHFSLHSHTSDPPFFLSQNHN